MPPEYMLITALLNWLPNLSFRAGFYKIHIKIAGSQLKYDA